MKHIHGGKSSEKFFSPKMILNNLELSKKDTLLDGGCGNGYLSIAASKIVKKVISIDNYKESIDELKNKNIQNIDAILGSLNNIKVNDKEIDKFLLINVLHGLIANNEKKSIYEISRVIKKNGLLAIIEFKKETDFGPPKNIRLSVEKIKKLFQDFKKIKYIEFKYHFMIILQKNK